MVDTGELKLIGTLDTTDIERGQRRVGVGFDNVQQKAKSSGSSFSNLTNSATKLVGTFAAIGTIGGGALSALALNAPQTAGAMASMKANTQLLSIAVGEELAPAFESVAGAYADFVEAASQDGTLVNTGIKTFGTLVQGVVTDVNNLAIATTNLFSGGEGEGGITNKKGQTLGQYFTNDFLPEIQESGVYGTIGRGLKDYATTYSAPAIIYNQGKNAFNEIKSFFFDTDTLGGNGD